MARLKELERLDLERKFLEGKMYQLQAEAEAAKTRELEGVRSQVESLVQDMTRIKVATVLAKGNLDAEEEEPEPVPEVRPKREIQITATGAVLQNHHQPPPKAAPKKAKKAAVKAPIKPLIDFDPSPPSRPSSAPSPSTLKKPAKHTAANDLSSPAVNPILADPCVWSTMPDPSPLKAPPGKGGIRDKGNAPPAPPPPPPLFIAV
eukprot:NODE_6261_length_863_cov_53.231081_g6029_i0.p1 GENE.NODE_6261_length_863_cov_53.231081_g6029_i0~~NODE_6261_length_863_cov_53.231081_g6029_i0.p1  ORF type:complete len:239 (+),score=67.28 NODE_6261_length_863_cov_53.231081_g6029_i0:104-718(+)